MGISSCDRRVEIISKRFIIFRPRDRCPICKKRYTRKEWQRGVHSCEALEGEQQLGITCRHSSRERKKASCQDELCPFCLQNRNKQLKKQLAKQERAVEVLMEANMYKALKRLEEAACNKKLTIVKLRYIIQQEVNAALARVHEVAAGG